jgi:hypothetical protein
LKGKKMKKITAADIELRKSTERGGFSIIVKGEHWGNAAPQWCGGRGLMHRLVYPDGSQIQDAQENGYRYQAKVRGYAMRQLHRDDGESRSKPVPKQEDAIKTYVVALINRGLVESPSDRTKRRTEATAKRAEEHTTTVRHQEWARDGLISLAKIPGISDKEVFALKYAFKDIFHQDMP